MKNIVFLLFLFISFYGYSQSSKIYVDFSKKGNDIPKSMYGIFFEEINHAGDGGLYAELIQNRGFEEQTIPGGMTYSAGKVYAPHSLNYNGLNYVDRNFDWNIETKKYLAWSLTATGCTVAKEITDANPLNPNTPNAFHLTISNSTANGKAELINSGYWGIAVKNGEKYNLRFYLCTSDYNGVVTAKIYDPSSNTVVGSQSFNVINNGEWTEYTGELTANKTINQGDFRLEFSGNGNILIDYVSLFPQNTFKNRPNGLRKDIAEFIGDMKPAFMRWPGGCIVEGITLDNRVKWKETLGDPMTRRGEYSLWGYRSSWGMGYHEFLQFCEDAGMDAMFVGNAGMACAYQNGDYVQGQEALQPFLQDFRDAIEYATGDPATNEWAAKRAAAGHPEPFPLKYVEIGNENGTARYVNNFNYLYGILKKEYPQITFINTLAWWAGELTDVAKTDMIDPHWYVAPNDFYNGVNTFDDAPRGKYDIYVGEYACNTNVGKGNMEAALSEAVFISGMERNSDIVKMASYAPLLSNDNQPNWSCNLIWLNSDQVIGRASYYVQKMFAENRPDYNLATSLFSDKQISSYEGRIGLGTWATAAEYRSVKVSKNDGSQVFYQSDFTNNQQDWKAASGAWSFSSGTYSQTDMGTPCISMMDVWSFRDCTIEVEARKISGAEGFLIIFGGDKNTEKDGYRLNLGGWNNTKTAIERVVDGNGTVVGDMIPYSLESNRWYTIKIVLKNATSVECYVDNKLILTYTFPPVIPGRLQAIGGYDKEKGEAVLKVTNAESNPFEANILLNVKNIQNTGEVITLNADYLEQENSFVEPELIYPVVSEYNNFSSDFNYTFKPYSFTILRIKSDEAAAGALTPEFTYSDDPVLLHPTGEKLSALLELAKDSYLPFAAQANVLKAEMDIAEALLNQSGVTNEDCDTEYIVLEGKLNGYFKAQMLATNENTSKIQNYTFASGSTGWICAENPTVNSNVAEYFWKSFDMKQKIEGLENGYYLATVQAFYRDGGFPEASAALQNGTEALNAIFYAGLKTTPVASVFNHRFTYGWNGYCNTMSDANQAFSADECNFINYLIVKVDDGTLTIGLRKSITVNSDWCCFDNFRLFRIPGEFSAIVNPVFTKKEFTDSRVYDIYGRVVANINDLTGLRPGIYISGGKKIIIKK